MSSGHCTCGRHVDAAGTSSTELYGLLLLAERLLAATDTRAAAAALLDGLVDLYGFPRAVLVSAAQDRVTVVASHGLSRQRPNYAAGSPAVTAALREQTTRKLRLDPTDEPWLTQMLPAGSHVLIIPMISDGARQSLVLQLPSFRDRQWHQAIREPLERVASAAAHILRTLTEVERLQLLSATDSLTMVGNRRTFTTALEREIARSTRSGNPLSLVMLDLDEFKTVNDLHGHQAGDDALLKAAEALSMASRDLDTTARYGGEEFVVILPDCDAERSIMVAERLRAAVATADAVRPLTASAGVATYPTHASDVETLVLAADQALLQSKRNGRNRTTAALSTS